MSLSQWGYRRTSCASCLDCATMVKMNILLYITVPGCANAMHAKLWYVLIALIVDTTQIMGHLNALADWGRAMSMSTVSLAQANLIQDFKTVQYTVMYHTVCQMKCCYNFPLTSLPQKSQAVCQAFPSHQPAHIWRKQIKSFNSLHYISVTTQCYRLPVLFYFFQRSINTN